MAHGSSFLGTALLIVGVVIPFMAQAADTPAHVDTSANTATYYPASSQNAGEEGSVVLSVNVDARGLPSRIKVAQSSGYADLDVAAIETALNWHYLPATHDGDPHPDQIAVRVEYRLPPQAGH